jgi:ribulose-phosphate 3-epimerase
MSIISPTITTNDMDAYKTAVAKLSSFAERVQIDISDGGFAPPLITESHVWWPNAWEADIHMMVKKPSKHMEILLKLKPHLVIFHAEVEEDLVPLFAQLKGAGIKAGVALLRPTYPQTAAAAIEAADHVMIFSGDLGKQGGKANLIQLEKVRLIKKINSGVEIGWDGGINVNNALSIAQGGVDVLNVGKTISDADNPAKVYAELTKRISKEGVV